MYDLARGGYSTNEILAMLRGHRTVDYRFELLDKNELPIGRLTADGTIDYDAESSIKRAARLTVQHADDIDFLNDRVRPYMVLQTPTGALEFPLGVYLMSSPNRTMTAAGANRTVECYDKAQILTDDKFTERYRIGSGASYTSAVAQILTTAGILTNNVVTSDKTLAEDIEFETGTTKLDAINFLLQSINYNKLWFDSLGTACSEPYTLPELRLIETEYSTGKDSITFTGATERLDIFGTPNKIVRYLESAGRSCLISSKTNSDPTSPLSTVSRGRTIVDIEAVNDIADQTTLDAYVSRLASEAKVYQEIDFVTACMPGHEDLDCIYVQNGDLNISGRYIQTAYKMELHSGGRMSHTVKKVVSI